MCQLLSRSIGTGDVLALAIGGTINGNDNMYLHILAHETGVSFYIAMLAI